MVLGYVTFFNIVLFPRLTKGGTNWVSLFCPLFACLPPSSFGVNDIFDIRNVNVRNHRI
jgi:hypothetical protein